MASARLILLTSVGRPAPRKRRCPDSARKVKSHWCARLSGNHRITADQRMLVSWSGSTASAAPRFCAPPDGSRPFQGSAGVVALQREEFNIWVRSRAMFSSRACRPADNRENQRSIAQSFAASITFPALAFRRYYGRKHDFFLPVSRCRMQSRHVSVNINVLKARH